MIGVVIAEIIPRSSECGYFPRWECTIRTGTFAFHATRMERKDRSSWCTWTMSYRPSFKTLYSAFALFNKCFFDGRAKMLQPSASNFSR